MGKKKFLISEQDLTDLILKSLIGSKDSKGILDTFLSTTKPNQTDTSSSPSSNIDTKTNLNVPTGEFPVMNLNNPAEYETYKSIADKFISTRKHNLLGITGSMLADGAKNAQTKYGRYVPVELALSQLAAEGGFDKNPSSRPIRTKNPFNVGNVNSGKNIFHNTVQSGIQAYFDLIARSYLTDTTSGADLIKNFVNKRGLRYATGGKYEALVGQIANQVKNIASPIYATLSKKISTDLT
jgi:hypothetical protein